MDYKDIKNILLKTFKVKNNRVEEIILDEIDDFSDITDEIERSIMEMKIAYDLPTEEVELSVESRRRLRKLF